MKNRILLLFCTFFAPFFSNAQSSRVEGVVVADTAAIYAGQVTLFTLPDSTLIKGTYMDSTYFSMDLGKIKKGDYYARISIPGYVDTLVNFTLEDSVTNLGVIPMSKNTELDVVDIVYRKEMFKRTMDGVTVSVEGTNLQTLTNLFEVLKASPKITSPDNERIEIIGRGAPLILVDRQAIVSNDELKAIPASQIERIEIITRPSAKYRAQGSSNGVIEVYTKDFHLEGYNLTINSSAGVTTQLRPTASLSLGLSVKKKKLTVSGYLGANYVNNNGFGTSNGRILDGSERTSFSDSQSDYSYLWQYYNLKGAYTLSKKARISFGINGHGSVRESENTSESGYSEAGTPLLLEQDRTENQGVSLRNNAFVNYTLETDTNGSAFEVNMSYLNRVSNENWISEGVFQDYASGDERIFRIRNESRDLPNIGEIRITNDTYIDTSGWRVTYGGSYSLLSNKKRFDRFNDGDGVWQLDPEFSNSYDYTEHNGSLFAEVTKKWKKVGFKIGIRGELTRLNGFSNTLDKTFIDSLYILPFPSASFMYEPNEKIAFTAFYDAGINRPQFSNFDPFVRVQDSLSISYGNPFLSPSTDHTVGLETELFYKYSLTVSYTITNNPISSITFVQDTSFIRETTPLNALKEQGMSASLSAPFQLSWLQGWNSFWMDYSKYTFTEQFGREPFFNLTYGVYSYLTFQLPKELALTNSMYLSKWGGDGQRNNAIFTWGLQLMKKFKGGNFQVYAKADNIIPMKYQYTAFNGNFVTENIGQNQFTSFKLGFFLKVGRLRNVEQIKESSSGQSNRL